MNYELQQDDFFEDADDIGAENEDDLYEEENLYNQAVIWGTDWTAETINSQLLRGNIDLNPKFQRRDAWSNKAKSRFIESLALGFPIPQIILAESKKQKGKYIVIDGKQRLLTIRQFFSDLNTKELSDNDFKPLKLSCLELLEKLNGSTYSKMKDDPSFSEERNQLENQSIRTTIIKNWPNESFLFAVFHRMNTGSIKLSPQELRQALHPGPFIDFADEFSTTSKAIKEMLNLKKADYRMRDVELVIRYYANKYFLKEYDGNLKKHFDKTVEKLNNDWKIKEDLIQQDALHLDRAISTTISIFGGRKSAFSKWSDRAFQGNFNRAIFDIMVYYFSVPEIADEAESKPKEIVSAFKQLCESDQEFLTSFEHTTKSMESTFKRLTTWGNVLADVLDTSVRVPQNVNGVYGEEVK